MVNNPPGDPPKGVARKHRVSASQCFDQPVAAYMSGDIEQRTSNRRGVESVICDVVFDKADMYSIRIVWVGSSVRSVPIFETAAR